MVTPELADARRRAARAACELVRPGMIVGLGTGDTAAHAVRALAERARAGLQLVCVATSRATAELARAEGLVLCEPEDLETVDLTIDGADEIDPALRLIKGAGGALTREKLVAHASARLAIVAFGHTRGARLGARPRLPVELVEFAHRWTIDRLRALGLDPALRLAGDAPARTDGGGLLVDCALPKDADLDALAAAIKSTPGVVEHGLFLTEAHDAFVGWPDRVEHLSRKIS